jgi:hypothetical protein
VLFTSLWSLHDTHLGGRLMTISLMLMLAAMSYFCKLTPVTGRPYVKTCHHSVQTCSFLPTIPDERKSIHLHSSYPDHFQ